MTSESFTRLGSRRGIWDVSRDCEEPVPVVLHSRATERVSYARNAANKPRPGIEVTLMTSCRKCRVCMRKRTRLWQWRAKQELAVAPRSWLSTLTVEPAKHYWIDECASTRTRDFWHLSEAKKFETRVRVLGGEVTKYLKRLRKGNRKEGWPATHFRYLMVSEMHDSPDTSPEMRGRPHCHLFIHEVRGMPSLVKRRLEAHWPLGFSSWKLADDRAYWYVPKYLTKANDARVRASIGYGNPSLSDYEDIYECQRS